MSAWKVREMQHLTELLLHVCNADEMVVNKARICCKGTWSTFKSAEIAL